MPSAGYAISITQGVAGLGKTGSVSYLSHELNASYHFKTIKTVENDFVLSFLLKTGHIRGLYGRNIVAKDRFMFGLSEMRGFEINGIGPRIAYTNADGSIKNYDNTGSIKGNQYAYFSMEHTFPNFTPKDLGFTTSVFFDAGFVRGFDGNKVQKSTNEMVIDSSKIRTSAGINLSWRSPMGPIGVSFGRAISKESYDDVRVFRLNLGMSNFNF
jgi:outer membrane protein insertion porin family